MLAILNLEMTLFMTFSFTFTSGSLPTQGDFFGSSIKSHRNVTMKTN